MLVAEENIMRASVFAAAAIAAALPIGVAAQNA